MANFVFDLQRFGGKGGTTVTQTYEPTKWEEGMQELEYNYSVSCLIPNAMHLSNVAKNHLNVSGASIPINFAELFTDADFKIETGQAGLINALVDLTTNAPPSATQVASSIGNVNDQYLNKLKNFNKMFLEGIREWIDDVPVELYQDLKGLKSTLLSDTKRAIGNYGGYLQDVEDRLAKFPDKLLTASEKNGKTLTGCGDEISDKANTNYSDLDGLVQKFACTACVTNRLLNDIDEDVDDKAKENYEALGDIVSEINDVAEDTNQQLSRIERNIKDAATENHDALDELVPAFQGVACVANQALSTVGNRIDDKADVNYETLEDLAPKFTDTAKATNKTLSKFGRNVGDLATENYDDLDRLIPKYAQAACGVNLALNDLNSDAADRLTKHYDNYDEIIPHFLPAAHRANKVLAMLETGKVPRDWQWNMQTSIKPALENTLGKTINDHGQRGVLNSSVTNEAIFDIERNVADEVARQYQENITQISNLAEQRWKNTEDALNDMKNSYNDLLGGYLNGLGQRGQLIENQFTNANTALMNQNNTFNAKFSNATNALNQRTQLEETSYNNSTGALQNQGNTFNVMYQNYLNDLGQRAQLIENEHNNAVGAFQNQANTFNSQFSNAINATAQKASFSNQRYTATADAVKEIINVQQTLFKDGIEATAAQLGARQNELQLSGDMWMKIVQALKQRNDTNAQWYGIFKAVSDTEWAHTMAALEAASGWYRNRLNGLQLYTQLWDTYINHATKRIAMSAAAQEAAQNSAIRLWNASIGLNQSATGVLVALSGQGTKITTQQQTSGDFWGGLFGGVASAFAGGYGGILGKAAGGL